MSGLAFPIDFLELAHRLKEATEQYECDICTRCGDIKRRDCSK